MTTVALLGACTAAFSSLHTGAPAKKPPQANRQARLDQVVAVPAGRSTLAEICRAISQQCEFQVEPAGYLRDHVVTAYFPKMTARNAVNILADMGGWKQSLSDERLVISRPTGRPGSIDKLPASLRACLPLDYQAYLGIDRYTPEFQEIYTAANPSSASRKKSEFMRELRRRTSDTLAARSELFAQSVEEALRKDGRLAYTDMTDAQRSLLIETLVLGTLGQLIEGGTWELLCGEIPPYVRDPAKAEISLRNGLIEVGMNLPNGAYIGYGAQRHSSGASPGP